MDPLTEPLITHPQTTRPRSAIGTERVAPGGLHLGRHREQRPGHRAQDPRFRYASGLHPPGAFSLNTGQLPPVVHVVARTTDGRGRATLLSRCHSVAGLRMVGVACRDPLRMVGVAVTPALRMVGATGSRPGPAGHRGLERGQSSSRGGPSGHWPPAAIVARASASRHRWWSPGMCQTASVTSPAARGSIAPTATRRVAACKDAESRWRATWPPVT